MQFSRKFKKSSLFFIFICIIGFYIFLSNYAHLLWLKQESSNGNHQQHVVNSNNSNIIIINDKPTARNVHRLSSLKVNHQKQQLAFTSNHPDDITSKRPTKISLADEYCNFPETIKNHHEEGKVKNGTSGVWKLMQAHIVLRHGDRSPLNQIFYETNNIKANYCQLNEDMKPNHELLHEFIKDIKHDYADKPLSRGHHIAIPFPNLKICSNGYLSQQGVVQELENGVVLKKQYSNHFDVISNPSIRLKKVYVETTATARTYQSAVAFLYGFLSKFELQQVDIQLSTSGVFSTVYKTCKRLATLEQELMAIKYEYFLSTQKKNETNKRLANMLKMTEHSGPFIDRILNGYLCKGYKLPCTDDGCVTKKELEILLDQETNNIRKSVEHGVYRDVSLLSMQPFLKKISDSMKAIIKETSPQPETFVYSGHDVTLKPLLCALGLDEFKWPKMASRLVLELWKNNSNNKFYIRVIYNGKDYTNRLKFCTNKELCAYSEFVDFVNVKIFKHFNASSLIAACST